MRHRRDGKKCLLRNIYLRDYPDIYTEERKILITIASLQPEFKNRHLPYGSLYCVLIHSVTD
jgi:hypothetical protein